MIIKIVIMIICHRIVIVGYYVIEMKLRKMQQISTESVQDWVGKVIHWEFCKKFKFDRTTEWYMHKVEFSQRMRRIKFSWIFIYKMIT